MKQINKQNKEGRNAGKNNPNWQGGKSYTLDNCTYCGKEHNFRTCNYKHCKNHFCSMDCKLKWGSENLVGKKANAFRDATIISECDNCHKLIKRFKSRFDRNKYNFCSVECSNIFRKEAELYVLDKNPAWLGGLSFEPYSTKWNHNLREKIRDRDNHTCQICKKFGNNVHHINYDKKDCSEENLITLCDYCHGKTNHNREQWIEQFNGGDL